MTVSKMAKWLRRDAWNVEKINRLYLATRPGCDWQITYYPNGPDSADATAVCLGVSRTSGSSTPTYCDSLAQALRRARSSPVAKAN